jgi:hypothetical protein
MASNDFHAVKAVLSPQLIVEWPQSCERIRGPENFAGLIVHMVEYWPDPYPAPENRRQWVETMPTSSPAGQE